MKRISVLIVLSCLSLAGCMALPQLALSAASIAAGNLLAADHEETVAKKEADRCYAVAMKAEQQKLGPAEKRRLFTAERCPM